VKNDRPPHRDCPSRPPCYTEEKRQTFSAGLQTTDPGIPDIVPVTLTHLLVLARNNNNNNNNLPKVRYSASKGHDQAVSTAKCEIRKAEG